MGRGIRETLRLGLALTGLAGAALGVARSTPGPEAQSLHARGQTCFQLAQIAAETAALRASRRVSKRQIAIVLVKDYLDKTGKRPPRKLLETVIGVVGLTHTRKWTPQEASGTIYQMCRESRLPMQQSGLPEG